MEEKKFYTFSDKGMQMRVANKFIILENITVDSEIEPLKTNWTKIILTTILKVILKLLSVIVSLIICGFILYYIHPFVHPILFGILFGMIIVTINTVLWGIINQI
jgi:hypothetical protein